MLQSLRIQNFRAFSNLEIDPLSRVNLLIGQNNSGKTSLLEALFLLSAGGNPQAALNQNVVRMTDNIAPGMLSETFWKAMFNGFDVSKEVEISAKHTLLGQLELKFTLEQPNFINLPAKETVGLAMPEMKNTTGLKFSYRGGPQSPVNGQMRVTVDGFHIEQPTLSTPFNSVILSSRVGNHKEDAQRLGELRRQKRGKLLTEALRIVEPRLTSVEDNSAAGVPMIWGDVGLRELVPLHVMGEGMTRIARLILAISSAPDGIVLVDEIENGLHHSVLAKVWQSVSTAAEEFNTQVFASTHSFECLEAAQNALNKDCFHVCRLEFMEGDIDLVRYDPVELATAVTVGLEVR